MRTAAWHGYKRGGIRDLLPKGLREGLNSSRPVPGFCSHILEIHPFPKSLVRNFSLLSKQVGRRCFTWDTEESRRERENKPTSKKSVKKISEDFPAASHFPWTANISSN